MYSLTTTLDREALKIKIKDSVESFTGQDIMKRNRDRPRVEARYIACKVMYDSFKNISLSEIGRFFKLNHATVLYGIKNVSNWMETDVNMKQIYYAVMTEVNIFVEVRSEIEDDFVEIQSYRALENRNNVLNIIHKNLMEDYKKLVDVHDHHKRKHRKLLQEHRELNAQLERYKRRYPSWNL